MATNVDRSAIHRQRAADLIELRKFERAAQEARRALHLHPDDADAYRLLAWALWGQGELSRAESAARSALRLAPDEADVHSTLALILAGRGKRQEAREHHERAITLAPTVAGLHTRYARFLLEEIDWTMEIVAEGIQTIP